MKIAVIGSGGVGGFYGLKLVQAGHDVTFLARGAHLRAIEEGGLHVENDLGNSFSFVEKMKILPIDLLTLLHLFIATLLPLTPLLLAVMPLKELLKLILKVFM